MVFALKGVRWRSEEVVWDFLCVILSEKGYCYTIIGLGMATGPRLFPSERMKKGSKREWPTAINFMYKAWACLSIDSGSPDRLKRVVRITAVSVTASPSKYIKC